MMRTVLRHKTWHALAVIFWIMSGVAMVSAQDLSLDYSAWTRTAERAEAAVEAGRASDVALEGLREELSTWRKEFVLAQGANSNTITTVLAQINALGPIIDGEIEADDIAAQRTQLQTRLNELRSPITIAEVANSRASGLIGGIDDILRERQADALLARGPSPLIPSNWFRGWNALTGSVYNTRNEVTTAWANTIQRADARANLPKTLALAVVGFVLLLLGRRWMVKFGQAVLRRRPTAIRWIVAFILSLGQMVLPLFGLGTLIGAFYSTGLIGIRIDALMPAVGAAGFILFVAMWLGGRVFPKIEGENQTLNLNQEQRRNGRLYSGLIGFVLACGEILGEFSRYDAWSTEAKVVVYYPLILLSGFLIWRIGRLLRAHGRAAVASVAEGDQAGYADRMYNLLGRVLGFAALLGPVLVGFGYFRAGQTAVVPMLQSLLLLAFILVLQRLLAEVYVLLRNGDIAARDGLVPVLGGGALVLLSAPLFALIWGVSENQLGELWTSALDGFQIGDARISASDFLTFAIVFVAGYMLTRLLQGTLKNTVLPKTKMDIGGQNALVSGIGYIGIFLAAVVAITSAGIDLSSLAIVAGALSVGIGFGLQNIVSNFVSGIILLIERPISEGDWIEVGGKMGYVRDISVRSTRIETFDRTDVIVPNADLVSGTVTNYTRGNTVGRVIVPVGVAYGLDTRRVEKILLEIGAAHPMVLASPAPYVAFQGFGADSMDFEIRAILRDVNWVLSVKSDMNHEIARRFAEEGIEIPFAQRDVWLRNPEAFGGTAPAIPTNSGTNQSIAKEHLSESDMADGSAVDIDGDGGDR